MITLSEIVFKLRQSCSAFSNRVGGTAAFGAAMDTLGADLQVPHAFVTPLYGQDVSESGLPQQSPQTVRQYFAIVVCIDNSKNGSGSGAGQGDISELDLLAVIQEQISNAFFGWSPVQAFGPVRYYRDVHLQLDNARLWHQFEFYLEFIQDPSTSAEQEAAISAIVGNMDTSPEWPQGLGPTIRQIYIQAHQTNGLIQTPVNYPPWLDDFFGRTFAGPQDSPSQVTARRPNYHIMQVNATDGIIESEEVRDHLTLNRDYVEPPKDAVTGTGHGTGIKEVKP